MFTTRLRPEQLKELERNVQEAARKFPGEVVRVRYSFGEDWSGDPAIYFRVVLSDEASSDERLREVADRVESTLFDDLRLAEPDYSSYNAYFNFRSKSEVDKLKEREWE
jgi:hypothetical protein